MRLHLAQTKRRRWVSIALVMMIAFVILIACDTTDAPQGIVASTPTTLGVPTSVTDTPRPTHTMNPDYATRYALATVGAQNREEFLTAIALSPPVPTLTPGGFPAVPTLTPVLGMGNCVPASSSYPMPENCWQGFVDGQLTLVMAGVGGFGSDQTQGLVWVLHPDEHEHTGSVPTYQTPQQLGPVQIVSVDGSHVIVAPTQPGTPPVTFVFDIITRQWVMPSPSPVPSTLPPTP